MPVFTPGRRYQQAFQPFSRDPWYRRLLARIELLLKGPLFGCRMCGNCMLQETALICPMACPKGMRNGPCGGSTETCYIDPERPCIWYKIYERAFKWKKEELLLEVLPPLDWEKTGRETWRDGMLQVQKLGTVKTIKKLTSSKADTRREGIKDIFVPIRQPEWWQGDSEYHPPAYDEPVSQLESDLRDGKFVVAAEITPPLSTATGKLKRNIELIKPYVSAINFTAAPSATPRMSSLACSRIATENDAEPVLQFTSRDCTRTGLQSQVIGASALGIRNILCITGDSSRIGPVPKARIDIVDVDAVQMLWILRRLRDEGTYLNNQKINFPPKYFLGAAASPMASKPEFQALREQKKVNAGAQFFQTNVIFDADSLDPWLEALDKRGVLNKVYILIGLSPLRSFRMAKYMHEKVPGISIPENILRKMEAAGDDAEKVGFEITVDLIEKIKTKPGINGIHIMPVGWEEILPSLLETVDLAPNPESVYA